MPIASSAEAHAAAVLEVVVVELYLQIERRRVKVEGWLGRIFPLTLPRQYVELHHQAQPPDP